MTNLKTKRILYVFTFFMICEALCQVLQPDSVQPGSTSSIIFYRDGEKGYYGNNVTLRANYLTSFANKVWFDYDTILPDGAFMKVFFMACNYSQLDDASTRIRLQIWRPVDLNIPSLKLVYQQVVQLPTTTTGPMLFTYSINQTVTLVKGDRIGWTYEGNIGPICFQYAEGSRTFLYSINNTYPEVGQLTTFDKIHLPSQFSIAALVDEKSPGSSGPAGSTGATGAVGATGTTGYRRPSTPSRPTGATGAVGATDSTVLRGTSRPSVPYRFTGTTGAVGSTGATVLQPDSVQPASTSSIVFYRDGENGYYGNNVTLRPACLTDSADKAWFDYETILPDGALRKVFFMACNYSQLDDASTRIRLQIWRPADLKTASLKLVYQQVVQLPTTTTGPMLFTYSINQTVTLVKGDRIGWTFEGSIGPICLSYSESHRTFFYRMDNTYLEVGEVVKFDPTFLPSQFSIAVLVDESTAIAASSTPSTSTTSTPTASTKRVSRRASTPALSDAANGVRSDVIVGLNAKLQNIIAAENGAGLQTANIGGGVGGTLFIALLILAIVCSAK